MRQPGKPPPKGATDAAARAAALLAAHVQTATCRVGVSEHCAVIESMHDQGAKVPLIGTIARDELGMKIGDETIAKHLARQCLCFRGDAYRGRVPSRTA